MGHIQIGVKSLGTCDIGGKPPWLRFWWVIRGPRGAAATLDHFPLYIWKWFNEAGSHLAKGAVSMWGPSSPHLHFPSYVDRKLLSFFFLISFFFFVIGPLMYSLLTVKTCRPHNEVVIFQRANSFRLVQLTGYKKNIDLIFRFCSNPVSLHATKSHIFIEDKWR